MPRINFEDIELQSIQDAINQNTILKAKLSGVSIANASFSTSEKDLIVNWIETDEPYQNKGIGTYILEYLANKALAMNLKLVIPVVHEELLSTFYYKWFKQRTNPNHIKNDEIEDAIQEKFANLQLTHETNPKLILTVDDLKWNVVDVHKSNQPHF